MSPAKRTTPTRRELDAAMLEEVHRAASRAIESAARCEGSHRESAFWQLLIHRLCKVSGTPRRKAE